MNNFFKYDIWLVNLDPTTGAEIKKTRPCLILNNNEIGFLPLKIIAPITDFKPKYAKNPWMVVLEPTKQNGLTKKSVVDVFQLRSVSEKRMIKKIGRLDEYNFKNIFDAITSIF